MNEMARFEKHGVPLSRLEADSAMIGSTRFLTWLGRTVRHGALAAARPFVSVCSTGVRDRIFGVPAAPDYT